MQGRTLSLVVRGIGALGLLIFAATTTVASAGSGSADRQVQIRSPSENVSILSSRGAEAILTASNLAPGESASGDVGIVNDGTAEANLTLASTDVVDEPGPNGGSLAAALDLTVIDLTTHATVYSGKLNALSEVSLGRWMPGSAHTFLFDARLPDTGSEAAATSGDNAYQGSSVSLKFVWTAALAPEVIEPDRLVKVRLRGRPQRVSRRGIRWQVSCEAACAIEMTGVVSRRKRGRSSTMFRPSIADLNLSDSSTTIARLQLTKRQLRALKRALKARWSVYLTLTATATGANGQTESTTTRIQLKRAARWRGLGRGRR